MLAIHRTDLIRGKAPESSILHENPWGQDRTNHGRNLMKANDWHRNVNNWKRTAHSLIKENCALN
ncbi:MAG: hypothetical protein CMF59_01135 [Leptospiraceae bacterium]|nr:hypothetical protein [Leptospiraceae bacterium]